MLTKLLIQTYSPSHMNHTGTTCGCMVLGLVVARRARTASASTASIRAFLSLFAASAIGIFRLIYWLEYSTKSYPTTTPSTGITRAGRLTRLSTRRRKETHNYDYHINILKTVLDGSSTITQRLPADLSIPAHAFDLAAFSLGFQPAQCGGVRGFGLMAWFGRFTGLLDQSHQIAP